ncbi:flagellin FliC [Candidatus Poribacteria bacterium]|nr:flagellin FliC [Candidatus Poribacteria bacterium]
MYRINTNLMSINGQRNLFQSSHALTSAMSRLSSGLRIMRSADDAAGITMSEAMRAQIVAANQSNRNISQAITMLQTADSGYEQIGNMLIRLKELATQASDSTLNETNRSAISLEATQLVSEIERIAQSTSYNGITLITSSGGPTIALSFYVGDGSLASPTNQIIFFIPDFVAANSTTGALSINGTNFGVTVAFWTAVSAAAVLVDQLDSAVKNLAFSRTKLGAVVNRLEKAQANIQALSENTSSARSVVLDADFAAETAALTRAQILVQAGTSILQQSNILPQNALLLLQG